jgi:hypothetical protein
MTSSLEGLSGGGGATDDDNPNDNKNNDNGKGNGKGRKKRNNTNKGSNQSKQKLIKPSKYSVYKYIKKDALIEQIQLAGHSKFLQIVNGKPILMNEIDLSEEKGLVLKPHLTIGGNSAIIPYQYNDDKEIQYFIYRAYLSEIHHHGNEERELCHEQ